MKKKDLFIEKAINDLIEANITFYGTAIHGCLTSEQLYNLYITFKNQDIVKTNLIPKNIQMFKAGYPWNKIKGNIPICYSVYGLKLCDFYARYIGNYFYMYFEYHDSENVIARDEVKHLIKVINSRASYLNLKEQGCVLFNE